MKIIHNGAVLVCLFVSLLLMSCGGGSSGSESGTSITAALPGELDKSFGTGGILRTGMYQGPGAMKLLPDGKIEVTGRTWSADKVEYMLDRYMADGSIDDRFGIGGTLTFKPKVTFSAYGMVHQQDGKVIIVGNGEGYDIHILRFLEDGTPDVSWGDRGPLISSSLRSVHGVMLQPDGKVVVVGSGGGFCVVRFNPDGSLDDTFGTHGVVQTSFHGFAVAIFAEAMYAALQPDGKMIVCGKVTYAQQYSTNYNYALVRYNSDGTLDTSFGTDGYIENLSSASAPSDFLLEEDGTIYVGDDSVIAYTAKGTFATSFDTPDGGCKFAVDSKGRLVVAWQAMLSSGYGIGIGRFLPNGNPDLSFGTNGKVIEKLSEYDYPITVLVQNDDRILVEVSSRDPSGKDLAVILRYMP